MTGGDDESRIVDGGDESRIVDETESVVKALAASVMVSAALRETEREEEVDAEAGSVWLTLPLKTIELLSESVAAMPG